MGVKMSEKIRCFIAIELSQEIRHALEQIENELQKNIHGVNPIRSKSSKTTVPPSAQTSNGVKWVKPDNIHLTLKFLGHIEKETIEKIKKIMDEIVAGTQPFKIRLSSAGAFPSPGRPRVIWIGIDEGNRACSQLANMIEERVASLGIEKESRAFHPHLTLARVKFLKDRDSVKNAFSSLKVPQAEMTATKITLFQSTLTREGSIYTTLHKACVGK